MRYRTGIWLLVFHSGYTEIRCYDVSYNIDACRFFISVQ